MLIWHSPFFLELMLSRHSGHCFRLDLSHHCSLSDKEYFPRIIVWNFVNTRVHVHLGISDEHNHNLFLSSSRGTPFFNVGVPLDDTSNAPSTQWNTEKIQSFFIGCVITCRFDLAHQNRTIAIASDFRVDGAKSPEIPQKKEVLG